MEPEREVVEVDPEVARAGEAVDEALEMFEKATARWQKALAAGAGKGSSSGKRARKIAAAREARDEAGDVLGQARARWHTLKQASDRRRRAATYKANVAAQVGERERERHQRHDELLRDGG